MAFHHCAQVLEGVELNLPYTLTRNADFFTNLFQRLATIAMQTESALDNRAVLVAQLAYPVIDDL